MRAIARKKLSRQSGAVSKASTFRLRSRPVPEQKIDRYMRANSLDEHTVFSDAREFRVPFLLPWLETNKSLKQLRLILAARHRVHLRFSPRALSARYRSIQARKRPRMMVALLVSKIFTIGKSTGSALAKNHGRFLREHGASISGGR